MLKTQSGGFICRAAFLQIYVKTPPAGDVFSYFLAKQSVLIAVPVKHTVAAAEKSGFCTPFWIEFDHFETAADTIGGERDVMAFCHRMFYSQIVFVIDNLTVQRVFLIGFLRFERRQSYTAARNQGCACRLDNITAYRADI